MNTQLLPPKDTASVEFAPATVKVAAFQGDLAQIALNDVIQLCDFACLTGELEVMSLHNNGSFYFDNGVLVFGLLESNPQRLGDLLLRGNCITPDQLEECLLLHNENGDKARLGNVLIQQGYLQSNMLTTALSEQVKEAFFETLTWKEGAFYFHSGKQPGSEEIRLSERVGSLLLEGMVRQDHE